MFSGAVSALRRGVSRIRGTSGGGSAYLRRRRLLAAASRKKGGNKKTQKKNKKNRKKTGAKKSARRSTRGGGGNDGSKILSQGAFGCVYAPGMRCPGSGSALSGSAAYPDQVSKLQLAGNAADTESEIGARVARIPQFQARFAPVTETCPLARAQAAGVTGACKPIANGNRDRGVVLMNMPFAGRQTLGEYIHDLPASVLPSRLRDLWIYLEDSIDLLGAHGIVHYDLKSNNIMFDARNKVPVIVDFGLSFHAPSLLALAERALAAPADSALAAEADDALPSAFYAYQPAYPAWCLETVLCSALWRGVKPGAKTKTRSVHDALTAAEVDGLAETVFAFYKENRSVQALVRLAHNATCDLDVAARGADMYNRHLALAEAMRGKTRGHATVTLLRTWHIWDKFALAGIFVSSLVSAKKSASTADRRQFLEHLTNTIL